MFNENIFQDFRPLHPWPLHPWPFSYVSTVHQNMMCEYWVLFSCVWMCLKAAAVFKQAHKTPSIYNLYTTWSAQVVDVVVV